MQSKTHNLTQPKPTKTSLEMKHDVRRALFCCLYNRGNVTPHEPYTKTLPRPPPTENVPRRNILDRYGQLRNSKGRLSATHKCWVRGHDDTNFEWMRPQQPPPKTSKPQVAVPTGHGCLTQSHHQQGNKHTQNQKMIIRDIQKIKIGPFRLICNGCTRNHRCINPLGRGSWCP